MDANAIDAIFRKAVETTTSVSLIVKYGIGGDIELLLDPYIYGSDILQYNFIWGYLPEQLKYYRLMSDFIISAKLTNKKFKMQSDACYLYSIEEEFWVTINELYEPVVRVYIQGLPPETIK